MSQLGFVGTSHRLVGFERLGRLVLPPEAAQERRRLREALGARELLYLATCNRVECYVILAEPTPPEQLSERLREFYAARGVALEARDVLARCGPEALRHAFAVTAALDSLLVGETEISGQMRRALLTAQEEGLAEAGLRLVHEEAQACARRVRARTGIGGLATSVGAVAVRKVLRHFSQRGPRVAALIGVGPMTIKAARALAKFPGELLFVNRTLGRAQALARQFDGRALRLDDFRAAVPPELDLLWTATAAPAAVVSARDLEPALRRAAGPPLVICDLGVPRDVHPAVDDRAGVRVVTMALLQRAATRDRGEVERVLFEARALIEEGVARLERAERFAELAVTSARALLADRMAHIGEGDQQLLVRFAEQLATRLARQPQGAPLVTA